MSTALSPPRPGPIGDLHLIPFSPWSHRVLLVLKHSRAQMNVHEYKPMISEFVIWIRLGFPRHKITAPALFRQQHGCLMDSHGIARIIDGARAPDVPTMFPPAGDALLRRLVAHAETLANFGRGEGLRAMQADPRALANLMFPPFLAKSPLGPPLARFIGRQVASKYSDESDGATKERARAALEEIAEVLRNAKEVDGVRYVVEDRFTYADIVLVLSLPFVRPESSRFKDVPPHPIGDDFPSVKKYAEAILTKHVRKEDLAFPPPKYNAKGEIV